MNALEILTRHKLEGKIVLKCKGNRATQKLSKDMGFSHSLYLLHMNSVILGKTLC
jgi:hypothetical protein